MYFQSQLRSDALAPREGRQQCHFRSMGNSRIADGLFLIHRNTELHVLQFWILLVQVSKQRVRVWNFIEGEFSRFDFLGDNSKSLYCDHGNQIGMAI